MMDFGRGAGEEDVKRIFILIAIVAAIASAIGFLGARFIFS